MYRLVWRVQVTWHGQVHTCPDVDMFPLAGWRSALARLRVARLYARDMRRAERVTATLRLRRITRDYRR